MARGDKKRPAASRGDAPPGKRAAVAQSAASPSAATPVVAVAAACQPARAAFEAYERLIGGADPTHASLDALLQQAAGGEWLFSR